MSEDNSIESEKDDPEIQPKQEPEERKFSVRQYIIGICAIALIVFLFISLIIWIPGTWNIKIAAFFAITAIYGFEIELLSKMPAFKNNTGLIEDMVSLNIVHYTGSNFLLLTIAFFVASVIIRETRIPILGKGLIKSIFQFIENLSAIVYAVFAFVILIAYGLVHLFIISMISYFPMVFTSIIVNRISESVEKFNVTINSTPAGFQAKDILGENLMPTKGYFLAIPSVLFSLFSAVLNLFMN